MKFYKNNVVSSFSMLIAGLACSSAVYANAIGNNDGGYLPWATTNQTESAVNIANLNKQTKIATKQYFVILNDAPLATYRGGVDGLSATNVLASKNSNATYDGKLDTKSIASKRYRNHLAAKQAEKQLHLELKLKRQVQVTHKYSIVLNGFVAELSPTEVALARQVNGIKMIQQVGESKIHTDSGPAYSGADKVWSGDADYQVPGNKGEGIIVAVIDSGIASFLEPVIDIQDTANLPPHHPSFADVGADGHDHTNPWGEGQYIGDCVDEPNWCNDKLIGVVGVKKLGEDIVNGRNDESRSRTGQDLHGHGTHVASTAAGNVVKNISTESELGIGLRMQYEEDFTYEQISGVAPHANIISFQICDYAGSCNQSYAVDAIEQAIDLKVDVINYSIGGPQFSPWYNAQSLAFLAAREAGIHVATSAGNSGLSGSYSIGAPANSPWITSVAANSHTRAFSDKVLTLSGGAANFDETQFIGDGASSGLVATDIVFSEDIEFDDAKDDFDIFGSCGEGSLPKDAVKDKVVICNRGGRDSEGGLSRISKGQVLKDLGAAGMVLINTSDTFYDITNDDIHVFPAVHLNKKAGKKLLEWLEDGEDHKVAINDSQLQASDKVAGVMGNFSSRGPDIHSHDYLIPNISAPGVKILGAGVGDGMMDKRKKDDVTVDKDFVYYTGTSMSSPHVAGMYALMKKARPTWSPAEAQSALMLTAGQELRNISGVKDNEQVFEPANLHQTGSGLARVDLAIASGLIMHETEKGYMTADPYGDVPGLEVSNPDSEEEEETRSTEDLRNIVRDPIDDWHGEPSKINLASLSKGGCEYECSWIRTFKATKNATWSVSYSYLTDGFELSSDHDGQPFSVQAGDEFSITFTAKLTGVLEGIWMNGRVQLTPANTTIPTASLPVAVEFVAGQVPETIEVNAHRNQGSANVEGVITVGTDDLSIKATSLQKATIFTGKVQRAENPERIYDDLGINRGRGMVAIPVNIPAGTTRFVVEMLETNSPDIDIYVGIDNNSDGQIDRSELDYIHFWGATPNHLEMLDYSNPRSGVYWIMVHNYGDRYNNSDNDEFDPNSLVLDDFKLAVSVVDSDDDSLWAKAPKSVARDAEVPVTFKWDRDMVKGDRFYGQLNVATTKKLYNNVGSINITLLRGEDDVKLSLLSNDKSNQRAGFDISIAANNSGKDRHYDFTVELVAGSIIESFTEVTNAASSSSQAVEYEGEGDTITWSYVHPNGAAEFVYTLVTDYNDVAGFTDVTPTVYSVLDAAETGEYSTLDQPVMVAGSPIFDLSASALLVDPLQRVTLTATLVDAVIETPMLSYHWAQIEGPQVEFIENEAQISFVIPKNSDGKALVFEMNGHNGERAANTETISLQVSGEDVGNSGSLHWAFILLAALTFSCRQLTSSVTTKRKSK